MYHVSKKSSFINTTPNMQFSTYQDLTK